jgi:hypothetical protein
MNLCKWISSPRLLTSKFRYQHGPFVTNTREEMMQTFIDYEKKQNGFEPLKLAVDF